MKRLFFSVTVLCSFVNVQLLCSSEPNPSINTIEDIDAQQLKALGDTIEAAQRQAQLIKDIQEKKALAQMVLQINPDFLKTNPNTSPTRKTK